MALKAGYVVQLQNPDYGVDLSMVTFDDKGVVGGEQISLQIKATDHMEKYLLKAENIFSFPVESSHYFVWTRRCLLPVFLIVYDAIQDEAYWLHIQEFDQKQQPECKGDTVSVHIPCSHVLGVKSMHLIRQRKNDFKTASHVLYSSIRPTTAL